MATETSQTAIKVMIPKLDTRVFEVKLTGDSPLICHAWSDKAKRMMLEKQQKKAGKAKAAKDPEDDYRNSLYNHPDGGYGFPAVAFKNAAVSACRFVDMKMTEARGAFHVLGEMVAIEGEPNMREDMVRLNGKTADIRYRGEFKKWGCVLTVSYNGAFWSPEQIINLFNSAGFGVGVGEWRPEKNGSYGMFHVEVK